MSRSTPRTDWGSDVAVTLLDLRERPAELPPRLGGRILVLDGADTLLKHADVYQALVSQPTVAGLICVGVGDAGEKAALDGVALALPAPLRPDGEQPSAVVWVGDPGGLDWTRGTPPSYPDRGESALSDLVAALQVDKVFDWVLATVAKMPEGAANPGVRVAQGPADIAAVALALTAAVRALCAPGDGASRVLAAAARRVDSEHDPAGAQLAPPITTGARDARRGLDRITELVGTIGSGWALFGSDRPTASVGLTTQAAVLAAERYRTMLDQLLNDMDGHLEEGRPTIAEVMELGVAEPRPARDLKIAAGLRKLARERLDQGVTLPALVQELQVASAFSAPQGVSTQHEQVRRLKVPPAVLPPFARWPLGLWTLPLVVLCCLATVVLPGPGPDGPVLAVLLGAVWTGAGWLLAARRPDLEGERGFAASAPAALTAYAGSAALGVIGGYVLRDVLVEPPTVPYAMAAFGALALVVLVLAGLSWRAAARRWRARLPLADLGAAVASLDEIASWSCVAEWQPLRRRRAIAAVAGAAAAGVETIERTLAGGAEALVTALRQVPKPDPVRRPAVVTQELFELVKGDLAEICQAALDPIWAGGDLHRGTGDAEVEAELRRLLASYGDHIVRHGVLNPFRPGTDGAALELAERTWARSQEARDILRGRPDDRMTQLCDSRQLTYISGTGAARLVRFAPQRLLPVLRRDPSDLRIADDPEIVWTESGDLVGAIRLLPLRPESIRYRWDGDPL